MHQATPDVFRNARLVAAEELAESAVDETGVPTLIEHPHRHRQAVGQRAEARFALAQLHFHLLARGDVEEQDADLVLARLTTRTASTANERPSARASISNWAGRPLRATSP